MDCIFCQIVGGELPCQKLYEDNDVIAFLDIFPAGRGHCLVVPKLHYADLLESPPHVLSKLINVSKIVARAITSTLKADGFNLFLNNGEAAGQKVNHVHFHILPRYFADGLQITFKPFSYEEGEFDLISKKIRSSITPPTMEQLTEAIHEAAPDKKMPCLKALNLASEYRISSKELGKILNELQIKLRNCQLGCF